VDGHQPSDTTALYHQTTTTSSSIASISRNRQIAATEHPNTTSIRVRLA
jgi:hypothetical protein